MIPCVSVLLHEDLRDAVFSVIALVMTPLRAQRVVCIARAPTLALFVFLSRSRLRPLSCRLSLDYIHLFSVYFLISAPIYTSLILSVKSELPNFSIQ